MKTSVILSLIYLFSLAQLSGVEVFVINSGNSRVDDLVRSLVSKKPAPYPNGFDFGLQYPFDLLKNGYCWDQDVENAYKELKGIEPKYYEFLLKHVNDDRYSYSRECPYLGWTNYTVGEAVGAIIGNEWTPGLMGLGGYRLRQDEHGNSQTPLFFSHYVVSKGGYDKWVKSVRAKSRKQIDIDFISWCIGMEKSRGFESEESRKKLLDYLTKKLNDL